MLTPGTSPRARHRRTYPPAAFSKTAAGGETPKMNSPVKSEYAPHVGAVHALAACPHDPRLFASCGADGQS
jgi:hypothetical protein